MPARIKLASQRKVVAELLLHILQLATCGYMDTADFGAQAGDVLLMFAILVGQAEGRPLAAAKLASYVGMPRTTVIRRLKELRASGLIDLNADGRAVLIVARLNRPQMVEAVQAAVARIHRASSELSKMDTTPIAQREAG